MPTDAIPKHVRNLPAVIQQPQIMPEMRHCSQDRGDGGQAALARDLHRAGAQDQQHRCVHVDVCDPRLLHRRLQHRHNNCAVNGVKTWLQKKEFLL